jgi:methylphosphotriester-DNA--protein-cysteine methyltransferase
MPWVLFFMTQPDMGMIRHTELNMRSLFRMILKKEIQFAGNVRLKIYGKLSCWSGKRMKRENRVFFKNEREAMEHGFRACGHCMKTN